MRQACDFALTNKCMTPWHCQPILASATSSTPIRSRISGESDMKLEFCVACGTKNELQHLHLVTKAKGGSDAERNRITLCTGCQDKLHQQHRYDAHKQSQRIKTAFAARRARGASIGRPKKLMTDQCEEALQRLESGESRAAVARSYGLSRSTVSRIVRSARLSGNLVEAGLALQVTDARTSSRPLDSATIT